ncbi:hypothetical protein GCM10022408_12540 [Hymenobacter fastidiosus]|uniref:PKD-like domain-containing protein n=1 Tax=Hymenobacter fastidiosus TaxID=486264 RepID=A0ABP7RV44_9BACT
MAPVAGATSYQWTVSPANLTPSGTVTTSVPYLDITAPGNNLLPNGEVRVTASSAGCATSAPAIMRFQIGAGTTEFRSSATPYGYVCAGMPVVFEVTRVNARGEETSAWFIDEVYQGSNIGQFQVLAPAAGQATYVRVEIINSRGGQMGFG